MKPNFKSGVLYGMNLMGCEMGKTILKMNKPVYIRQAILDLSKTVMYEFHYNYILPKYAQIGTSFSVGKANENRISLCYIDTESFVYDIETEDFYEDIANDVESRFDTSGYTHGIEQEGNRVDER